MRRLRGLIYGLLIICIIWVRYMPCTNFSSLCNCRKKEDNTLQGTTWQIKFELSGVVRGSTYKLRVAIASATLAELQVNSLAFFFSHTHPHWL